MGMVDLFVPMTAIICFAVIIGLITRLIATGMHHRTIREAMRSDPSSVPLLTERLEARQPWADAVLGWIFVAFAAGIALLALTEPDPDQQTDMLRATIIPLVIGVTVLVFVRMSRPKQP
jgi:quinol-cytochrome oxidoreductase complex cytochrome b subunit